MGGAHGDGMPRLTGRMNFGSGISAHPGKKAEGVFIYAQENTNPYYIQGGSSPTPDLIFDTGMVTSIANQVQPRAYGVLPCVFLGPKNTQGSTP